VRRLIMWNVITLDGSFEGPKSWELDFHLDVWGDELHRFSVEQLHAADMLIFGRVTYEGMAAHWTKAEGEIADLMNAIPKAVFSRTLASADWSNATLVRDDPAAAVAEWKGQGDGDLYVFGSANLSQALIRAGLFDEYRLLIAPVVLGEGRPLFERGADRLGLRLLEARPIATGGILARYAPR